MAKNDRCPMCGEVLQWKLVDTSNKGFSVGKAAVGAVLLGSVGLLGEALGKKSRPTTAVSADFTTNIKT